MSAEAGQEVSRGVLGRGGIPNERREGKTANEWCFERVTARSLGALCKKLRESRNNRTDLEPERKFGQPNLAWSERV